MFMDATADFYDVVSILFSIGSGAIALVSLYFSFLKQGRLEVLPVRLYKVEPRTWDTGRYLKVTVPLTFLNTGAGQKVVPDLRIHVKTPSGPLILTWVDELDQLPVFSQRGDEFERRHPSQPTLQGYESIARVYGFESEKRDTSVVESLDKVESGNALQATIQIRHGRRAWRNLGRFTLNYAGRIALETDYARINP